MRLPAGYTSRPANEDDLEAMVAVANAYDVVDLGHPDTARQHVAGNFRAPGFDGERDSWLVFGLGGSVVAFGFVGLEPGLVLEAFGRVHPDHVGRGLGSFLVRTAERRAAELATACPDGLALHNAITSTDAAARRLLVARGYRLVRFFWHMERPLHPTDRVVPGDEEVWIVRSAEDPAELRRVRAVLDEAFRGHWMFEPEPFDEWYDHLRSTSASVLAAFQGGHLAGAVTFLPTSEGGWVEELGVRDGWRRRGLGALLLRHAFARLVDQGHREVRLNVDADNQTGATRVYDRVGMTVRREWLVYQRRFPEEGGRRGS